MNNKGLSQIELLVTLAMLSVGFLAAVGTFTGVARGILVTKTKSLASNLAQEKIEFLKNKSYFRLRVTSSPVLVTDPDPDVVSDPYNYPAETVNVGGIPFTRYSYVEKVRKQAASNLLEVVAWDAPDTGLKKVHVTVVWREGQDIRQMFLTNLRENPNRAAADVEFKGVVRDTNNVVLEGVNVEVTENPTWRDATDASGNYLFALSPGTYTLRASSAGYFTSVKSGQSVTTTNSPVSVDFQLSRMASGQMSGHAWMRDHLVISQVVGSTENAGTGIFQEYVEVYNPTTWTWTIASDPTTPVINLKYQLRNQAETTIAMDYNALTVGTSSYYLFANTSPIVVGGVTLTADAVFKNTNAGYPNLIKINTDAGNDAAGVGLAWASNNAWIDRLGWKAGGQDPPITETAAIAQAVGLESNEQYVRRTSSASYTDGLGRAYDSHNNSADFNVHDPMLYMPRNTAITEVPVSGSPAEGALVFADDGFSSPVEASATGYFSLTSIATGTWILSTSSGVAYAEETITVTAGSSNQTTLFLTTNTEAGYISGQVTTVGGGPLSGITVTPGNITTDANGRYRLSSSPGLVTVTANPPPGNSNYVQASSAVTVVTGQIVSNVNFTLSGGGKIRGKVTSDGTNPLPDIPVSVVDVNTTLEKANVLSKTDGYFEATVPTGTYTAAPIAEYGEVVTPSVSPNAAVPSGGTVFTSTFTVGPAYGSIQGSVNAGGNPITTGVMIIVTTATIAGDPPTINEALRSGSQVYYMASSGGAGTYEIDVRAGDYNVYAWYTTFSGNNPTTTRQGPLTATVTPGGIVTGKNFSW
jgi:hypothetical protein